MHALVFLICLTPIAFDGWTVWRGEAGPNPIEFVTHATGDWALRFLLMTLAITPARLLTGWQKLARFRRTLGLFAFFYAFLHLTTYLWLDKFFIWRDMAADVRDRPFIAAGLLSFLLLVPLALTSTKRAIRALGGKRWQMLHRLVYGSALIAVVHYYWLVKSDVRLPLLYGCILLVLLFLRWHRLAVAPRADL